MVITPVGHSMAMHWGIGAAFLNYAKLVLLDSTQPEDICHWIEREKVTAVPSVPALISRVVGMNDLAQYDLTSLRKISVGGAPSTPELLTAAYEKLKCVVINGFGSSEGTNMATRPGDTIETICSSVGKPACPYDIIKVVDENGSEVPPGVDGELVSKGPGIFTGYFKSEEENGQIFTDDGFFKTGDKARKDEYGNITITGRLKDIINRGGEKISALDIEQRLCAHPLVRDVVVVGMPDAVLGERICAYIVVAGGEKPGLEEIVQFLKRNGASVQQLPERIEIVDELPMTKVGKVDKKTLREDIRQKIENETR
jgi:non-ribosomal peptide synthetase component E (peptide arylation enzyme)